MSDCNPHPDAPHGFDRTASLNEDRYVCDCESWSETNRADDSLRTRIAAVLGGEQYINLLGNGYDMDDLLELADAVIRELCQEWRIDLGYDGYEFESDRAAAVERLQEIREDWGCDLPPTGVVLQRRYFTEWENDDE